MDKDDTITLSARHTRSIVRDTHVRGIDVSAAQGQPRWGEVLEDPRGLTFAWCKATDGDRGKDPSWDYNARELAALNGELLYGAYHVTHPSIAAGLTLEQDARAEALRLFEVSGKLALPPWVDFEINELDAPRQAAWLRAHVESLREHLGGQRPILYAGQPMLATLVLCKDWILDYAVIVPAYMNAWLRKEPSGRTVYGPALTFEEAERRSSLGKAPLVKPWTTASGWQFSGGLANRKAYLPGNSFQGINGWTDCDIFTTGAWMDLFR